MKTLTSIIGIVLIIGVLGWLAIVGIAGLEGLLAMYAQLDSTTLLILLAVSAMLVVHAWISAQSVRALANKTAAQPLSDAKLALYQRMVQHYQSAVSGKRLTVVDGSDQINLALLASPRVVEVASKLQDAIDSDRMLTVITVRFNALVESMRIDLGHSPALSRKLDAAAIVSGKESDHHVERDELANGPI